MKKQTKYILIVAGVLILITLFVLLQPTPKTPELTIVSPKKKKRNIFSR